MDVVTDEAVPVLDVVHLRGHVVVGYGLGAGLIDIAGLVALAGFHLHLVQVVYLLVNAQASQRVFIGLEEQVVVFLHLHRIGRLVGRRPDFLFPAGYPYLHLGQRIHAGRGSKHTVQHDAVVFLLALLRHGQYQVPLPLYLRDEGETPQAVSSKEVEGLLPAHLRVFAGTAQEGRHFHPGTRFAAHHRHHRAVQLDALLGQVLQVEGAYISHALPVVPPPALHHQQFVQRTAVRQVAGFEIPGGTVDVSFDVRHQQQVGQQAVAVLHLLPAVAHGNRERRLHGRPSASRTSTSRRMES